MTTHPMHLFDSGLKGLAGEPARPVRLAPTTQKDVFLNALLEAGTTKSARRSPLEWAVATGLHFVIVATLVVVAVLTPFCEFLRARMRLFLTYLFQLAQARWTVSSILEARKAPD